MTGEYWKTQEIVKAKKEQDKLSKMLGIHYEEHKPNDREAKNLTTEQKAKILEQKVTTAKAKKEMWPILRSPTTNRSMPTARIIADNGKNFVSQKQKADSFVIFYRDVSNLKFEKHEIGMKKALNSRLMSEVVNPEVCQGFTIDYVKAALRNINPT